MRSLKIVFLLLLVVSLAGAGGLRMTAAQDLEIKVLKLGFGVDPVFAPHIVAIEKGWFKEAGFESVETPTFTSGAAAGEALAAGEIQLWTPGNVPPISMRHNGLPIVVLGTNTLAYIEKLVVREDANVKAPEDLYNIRIGLLQGSTASAVLDNLAKHYGLDPAKLQVVNLQPPEQLTAFTNNEIQAFVVWNPWPYQAAQNKDVPVKILNNGTVSFFEKDSGEKVQVSYTRSLWVASEQFVRENPKAAKAMMDTLLKAQAYVADPANREEVVKMISEYLKQPVEQNEALWDDYQFTTLFDEDYVRDMKAYTDFLAASGRIQGDPLDPLDYTYTGFVEEFDPELVKVKGNWMP